MQSIANLKGGENCEVSWPTDDTPTIDCNSSEESGGGGGGDLGKVVRDVTEDVQDDKDGIKVLYTDNNESFIPFPSLSGAGKVDDVSIVPHSPSNIEDRLSILYADGTDKTENIPFEPAIDNIKRGFVNDGARDREVLSCNFNRGTSTLNVPFDIRLSAASQYGSGITWSDSSRWLISCMSDTNLSVQFVQAGNDGIAIRLGVYYI